MKRTILTIMTVLLISTACTDATRSQYGGLGSKHLIEMYSGGELHNEYVLYDLYYGQTVRGFSLVAENVNEEDYQTLIDNGICFKYEK